MFSNNFTFSISNHPNLPFLDSSSTGLSTTLAFESWVAGRGASKGALFTGAGAVDPFTGAAGGGWGSWGAPAGAVLFMTPAAEAGLPPAAVCPALLKNCAIPGSPGLKISLIY